MDRKIKPKKIPKPLPEWLCKAGWDATAVLLKVRAKDETTAWHNAWKRISKIEGGDSCLTVKVIRRTE